jgi:NADP-dependent 3-hydroxy acid dehydrogenase YdfG
MFRTLRTCITHAINLILEPTILFSSQFNSKMPLDSVLITGCSEGGLGSGLALAFQKAGLHVFATARNTSKLSYLTNLPNITLLSLDVTSPSSIAAALQTVQSTNDGKLKYLVNNSGVGMVMPLLDSDIKGAKKMFDVNVWGVLAVSKAFTPLVVKERGTVIVVGSAAGLLNVPWLGVSNYPPQQSQYRKEKY